MRQSRRKTSVFHTYKRLQDLRWNYSWSMKMEKASLFLTILLGAILLVSSSPLNDPETTTCGVQPSGANCGDNAVWDTEKQCQESVCGTSSFCCSCAEGYSVSDDGSCQKPGEEVGGYCSFITELELTTSNTFLAFVLSVIFQVLRWPCSLWLDI